MSNPNPQLLNQVETIIKSKIIETTIPPQGMDSEVFISKDEHGLEYAIKYGKGAKNDMLALNFLKDNKVNVAIPKVFGSFELDGKTGVILEKINFPLLDAIPQDQMGKYIPSMIKNLKEIHKVKSANAGLINDIDKRKKWKDVLLSFFDNTNPNLNWNEITKRKGLHAKLVLQSVEKIIEKIEKIKFDEDSYSLLHIDFNQRNLFVNPDTNEIAAIIDWGEAMFGDPIYDFARVRMLIWHFKLGDEVVQNYYDLMSYTPEQKKLDDLYWLSRVIEYLAYYSEELNEFNTGRIKLHQDFLRNFNWDILN